MTVILSVLIALASVALFVVVGRHTDRHLEWRAHQWASRVQQPTQANPTTPDTASNE